MNWDHPIVGSIAAFGVGCLVWGGFYVVVEYVLPVMYP